MNTAFSANTGGIIHSSDIGARILRRTKGDVSVTSFLRILLAVAAANLTAGIVPAMASAFTAGTVTAVAPDDGLNIR